MRLNIKREDLKQWLNEGLKKGATHCLIICDTWDLEKGFEYFPVYVMLGEKLEQVIRKYPPGGIEVFITQCDLTSDNTEELLQNFDMK